MLYYWEKQSRIVYCRQCDFICVRFHMHMVCIRATVERQYQETLMLRKINLAFVGALTVLPHLAFAADITIPSVDITTPKETSLPTANIESECRDAQATIDPELRSSAYEACVRDERSAFEQLRQRWAHFSTAARDTCIWPNGGVSLSYVALQTCLEMQPGGSLAVGVAGSDGLNSYSYDILGSPPPAMARRPPRWRRRPPRWGRRSPTTASSPPTMAPPSP